MADESPPSEPSAIEQAQQALAQAALSLSLNPASAAISAYVNGVLQSARLDALMEVLATPSETAATKEEVDAALLRALQRKTLELQDQVRRMQFAQAIEEARASPIIVSGRH